MTDRSELEKTVSEFPGDPAFADLAELLLRERELGKAIVVCVKGLSAAPEIHKGRLMLARAFFELEAIPFAVREIETLLEEFPQNKFLRRLLLKLSPEKTGSSVESSHYTAEGEAVDDTVAEAEFDFDSLDMLDEEEDK